MLFESTTHHCSTYHITQNYTSCNSLIFSILIFSPSPLLSVPSEQKQNLCAWRLLFLTSTIQIKLLCILLSETYKKNMGKKPQKPAHAATSVTTNLNQTSVHVWKTLEWDPLLNLKPLMITFPPVKDLCLPIQAITTDKQSFLIRLTLYTLSILHMQLVILLTQWGGHEEIWAGLQIFSGLFWG